MNVLKVRVERSVRPVRASLSRKMRMREELLAHLTEIYEDELQNRSDEQAAVEAAFDRFGDPGELTAELQASVSWIERGEWISDELVRRRTGETELRHALRMSGYYCGFVSVLLLGVLAVPYIGSLLTENLTPLSQQNRGFLLRVAASLIVLMPVNAFVFSLLGHGLRAEMMTDRLRVRSWWRIAVLCVLGCSAAGLSGWAFVANLLRATGPHWELMPRWLILAGLVPFAMVFIARMAALEKQQSDPWAQLEIDV
jgi:hypothetical protein